MLVRLKVVHNRARELVAVVGFNSMLVRLKAVPARCGDSQESVSIPCWFD